MLNITPLMTPNNNLARSSILERKSYDQKDDWKAKSANRVLKGLCGEAKAREREGGDFQFLAQEGNWGV